MTSVFNRRAALGLVGVGSAALLAACGSGTADSKPAERTSYKGEVKLEKYDTSAGEYVPATRENPAKNVPKPVKPENANEDSVAGLYSSIAFSVAAINYILQTGDSQYAQDSALSEKSKKPFSTNSFSFVDAIKEGKYWFSDPKLVYVLETEQPAKDGSKYTWPYSGSIDFGDFYVKEGEAKDTPEEGKKKEAKGNIKAEFANGAWKIDFEADRGSSPTPS